MKTENQVDNRFPKWIHDQLLIIAKEQGVSIQTVIRRLIKESILQKLAA